MSRADEFKRSRLSVDEVNALKEQIATLTAERDAAREKAIWEVIGLAREQMAYLDSYHYVTTKAEFVRLINSILALKEQK
jgi:hypothetical protein